MFTDWIKEYTPFFSNIGTFLKILKYVPGLAGKISSSMSDFEEDNDLNINLTNYRIEDFLLLLYNCSGRRKRT